MERGYNITNSSAKKRSKESMTDQVDEALRFREELYDEVINDDSGNDGSVFHCLTTNVSVLVTKYDKAIGQVWMYAREASAIDGAAEKMREVIGVNKLGLEAIPEDG